MIRLEDVARRYARVRALEDLDLSVERGERVALVGPSGAGKTTLFRLLNLTLRADSGRVILDGTDTGGLRGRALREVRRRIATIHQRHDLVARLSVLKNVLAGRLGVWSRTRALRAFLLPSRGEAEEAGRVLERVGIPEKLYERADRLSGGQQQRVAIARALFQDAELILADEPVASLDPARARSILELLVSTAEADGRTLLVSLHQTELALRYFSRIVGIVDGRIAFDLPRSDVDASRLDALLVGHASASPASGPNGA